MLHRALPAMRLRCHVPRGRICVAIFVFADLAALASDQLCDELHRTVAAQTALAREVETTLAGAVETAGRACVGAIFRDLALAASVDGRVNDVERYSERSIQLLETEYPPDHPILLRPLAFLSAASFELKKLAKSRQVFERLRRIPPATPEEQAMVHELASMLLRADGKLREAVSELRTAILLREGAARAATANHASFYHQLGVLYIQQEQYTEARDALGRASDILAAAHDTTPLDLIRVLQADAVIEARQGDWRRSEQKLAKALAIADAAPALDPLATRGLLVNYAFALRKVGRGRDARAIDKRLAALPPDASGATVDISQLSR